MEAGNAAPKTPRGIVGKTIDVSFQCRHIDAIDGPILDEDSVDGHSCSSGIFIDRVCLHRAEGHGIIAIDSLVQPVQVRQFGGRERLIAA